MKTATKKRKTKRSVAKTTVFKKLVVLLTIVNDNPSLTIVNDDPSLTIFNDDPSLTIINEGLLLTVVTETNNFFKTTVLKTIVSFFVFSLSFS